MIAHSLLSHSDPAELKIFYSYARVNAEWLQEFDRAVSAFDAEVDVASWRDTSIEPGEEWEPAILNNMAVADIVLLFVGQAFVDSEYCMKIEVPLALRRHQNGEARVIPILMESTDPPWSTTKYASLQALPRRGIPVGDWAERHQALYAIANDFVDLLQTQGLRHIERVRWEAALVGDAGKFTVDERLKAVNELTQLTGSHIHLADVRSGSVNLILDSSQDAYEKTHRAWQDNALKMLASRPIGSIRRFFGAGVRAVSKRSDQVRDDESPHLLLPSRAFIEAQAKALEFDPDDPIRTMRLIVDQGEVPLDESGLQLAAQGFMDILCTALAVPEDEVFVNLAPNEHAKLLSPMLSGTQAGHILLEGDLKLKRLAATLLHPDLPTGRDYWREVLRRCRATIGTTDVPLESYQRVWLQPEHATLYESPQDFASLRAEVQQGLVPDTGTKAHESYRIRTVAIIRTSLNVITESELFRIEPGNPVSALCDEVYRDVVMPSLKEQVNTAEHFVPIRGLYRSLVLSAWIKRNLRDHPKVNKFIDSGDPTSLGANVRISEASSVHGREIQSDESVQAVRRRDEYRLPENQTYFERYLEMFRAGILYVVRDEIGASSTRVTRTYSAGSVDFRRISGSSNRVA